MDEAAGTSARRSPGVVSSSLTVNLSRGPQGSSRGSTTDESIITVTPRQITRILVSEPEVYDDGEVAFKLRQIQLQRQSLEKEIQDTERSLRAAAWRDSQLANLPPHRDGAESDASRSSSLRLANLFSPEAVQMRRSLDVQRELPPRFSGFSVESKPQKRATSKEMEHHAIVTNSEGGVQWGRLATPERERLTAFTDHVVHRKAPEHLTPGVKQPVLPFDEVRSTPNGVNRYDTDPRVLDMPRPIPRRVRQLVQAAPIAPLELQGEKRNV